jgi:hypothetical protein
MGNRDFKAGSGNSPGHFSSARMNRRAVPLFDRSELSRRTARKLAGKVAKRTDFIAKKHRNGPWTGL